MPPFTPKTLDRPMPVQSGPGATELGKTIEKSAVDRIPGATTEGTTGLPTIQDSMTQTDPRALQGIVGDASPLVVSSQYGDIGAFQGGTGTDPVGVETFDDVVCGAMEMVEPASNPSKTDSDQSVFSSNVLASFPYIPLGPVWQLARRAWEYMIKNRPTEDVTLQFKLEEAKTFEQFMAALDAYRGGPVKIDGGTVDPHEAANIFRQMIYGRYTGKLPKLGWIGELFAPILKRYIVVGHGVSPQVTKYTIQLPALSNTGPRVENIAGLYSTEGESVRIAQEAYDYYVPSHVSPEYGLAMLEQAANDIEKLPTDDGGVALINYLKNSPLRFEENGDLAYVEDQLGPNPDPDLPQKRMNFGIDSKVGRIQFENAQKRTPVKNTSSRDVIKKKLSHYSLHGIEVLDAALRNLSDGELNALAFELSPLRDWQKIADRLNFYFESHGYLVEIISSSGTSHLGVRMVSGGDIIDPMEIP